MAIFLSLSKPKVVYLRPFSSSISELETNHNPIIAGPQWFPARTGNLVSMLDICFFVEYEECIIFENKNYEHEQQPVSSVPRICLNKYARVRWEYWWKILLILCIRVIMADSSISNKRTLLTSQIRIHKYFQYQDPSSIFVHLTSTSHEWQIIHDMGNNFRNLESPMWERFKSKLCIVSRKGNKFETVQNGNEMFTWDTWEKWKTETLVLRNPSLE